MLLRPERAVNSRLTDRDRLWAGLDLACPISVEGKGLVVSYRPHSQVVVYSIVGKVVQSIAFVYLALWNISLVSSTLGLSS